MLVDDHAAVRVSLSFLLRTHPEIEVVREAADGEEAVRFARELKPDVILMDICMPGMNGIDATKIIRSELPQIRIVGLSMYEEVEIREAMVEAGASLYLTKDGPLESLIEAVLTPSSPLSRLSSSPSPSPRKPSRG